MVRKAILQLGFGAAFGLVIARAQAPNQRDLHFDVASVRLNRTFACQGRWDFTAVHGSVDAENAPLRRIISRAYNLTDDRVIGPSWIESQCYDIKAKSSLKGATHDDLMSMLQSLLKERMHLGAHLDSEERPVFDLLTEKAGAKMPPDGAKVEVPPINGGKVLFMAKTLSDLCERLGIVTGRPVVDKTGLQGKFVIVLTYLPLGLANGDSADSSFDVFSAVREQLGLRLEPHHELLEVLNIDAIDKLPATN